MIAKLTGRIDCILTQSVILDVGGVGYEVFCNVRSLDALRGQTDTSIWIHTLVREDAFLLYGFLSAEEKRWFLLLTNVQGVGARVGLALLSALSPDALFQALAAGDKAAITQADGVGPKLAARLITELKDKVGQFIGITPQATGTTATTNTPAATLIADGLSALINLGYSRGDAFRVVSGLVNKSDITELDDLIKNALKELAS
jgi:Holliday junction DNA helicase RuvA